MKKILVAMSGGTDSSVACMLLREQGYDIQGVTMRMWDTPAKFSQPEQEEPDYILEARRLAAEMNFPHHVIDMRQVFRRCVIGDFVDEYLAGRTPNPCVQCNIHIKTKFLLQKANELGCDFIATGHYANIAEDGGVFFIEKGKDIKKDQSYFLWGLPQTVLQRMIFPLGGYSKQEIRAKACEAGFKYIAEKTESQDICFIDDDYRDFLKLQVPDMDERVGTGNFVDISGKVVGRHNGFPYYTIGQRKGLGIAMGEPMYVLKINAESNEIMIGTKDNLQVSEMRLRNCNFPAPHLVSSNEILMVRIRYKSRPISAYVEKIDRGSAIVKFVTPVEAVTPGQSAVIYRNERVLGGGIIC